MQASSTQWLGQRQRLFALTLVLLLVPLMSCEAIWGGLSRSNHDNCVVFPGSCPPQSYCSPELERCVPLGPPCTPSQPASICAITGPDRICVPELGRCATNVILDGVTPSSGPPTGGVPITLLGQYFRAGMRVTFDGTTANIVEVVSANKMIVTLPPSLLGPGPSSIRVEQADGGFAERQDLFGYADSQLNFSQQPITIAYYGDEIEVTDLDLDFDPDLIVQRDTSLYTAAGDGGGQFMSMLAGPAAYSPATTELESADLDNDGYPEIVYGAKDPMNGSNGVIYVTSNDKRGLLTLKQTLTLPSTGVITRVALGDLNGDTRTDLLVVYNAGTTPKLIVYPGISGGLFATGSMTVTFANSYNISLVTHLRIIDLNHDGRDDFIVSGKMSMGGGTTLSGFIHAISGMNVGSSMSDKLHDLTYLPSAAIMRDLNRDQNPDLIAVIDMGTSTVLSVSLSDLSGTFNTPLQYTIGPSTRLTRIDAADFNGDGSPDIVLWDKNSPRLRFLLSSSDGSLSYQDNELVLSQNPVSLRAKDLNGDNLGDLVVGFGSMRAVQAYLGFR